MSRKARVILAIIFVEFLLAGLWYYLTIAAVTGHAKPEAPRVIGETMGMAMGGFFGLGIILFILAAKADREKAKRESAERDTH